MIPFLQDSNNIWIRKLNAIRHQHLFQMQESFVLQQNTPFTPGIVLHVIYQEKKQEMCAWTSFVKSCTWGAIWHASWFVFIGKKQLFLGMLFSEGSWIVQNSYRFQNSFGSAHIPIRSFGNLFIYMAYMHTPFDLIYEGWLRNLSKS